MLIKRKLTAGLLVVAMIVAIASCGDPSPSQIQEQLDDVSVRELLEQSPIVHEQLTDDQVARIRKFHETFLAVFDVPFEATLEDFRKEPNLEAEILIWEQMATAYIRYNSGRSLTIEEKEAVFDILLIRTMASEEWILENREWDEFSSEEVKEIVSYYNP
jgi:hypothetical protein